MAPSISFPNKFKYQSDYIYIYLSPHGPKYFLSK